MRRTTAVLLMALWTPGRVAAAARQWPVEARSMGGPVGAAVERAARWLARFPPDELRFDAAVMLAMIRRTVDGDALRAAFETARAVADRDDDNPQRRFWLPGFTSPPEHTSRWTMPATGARPNTNRVLAEALHCASNGWRPATMRYVCGAMRDGGGYQTTHALWALDLAHGNGCASDSKFRRCARALQRELEAAQPARLAPERTLDVDLYAERLLMLAMTGDETAPLDAWARALLDAQTADGSWGVPRPEEPLYHRYHATAATTWALVEWYRREQ